MQHLDEGILTALLDGELSGAEQGEVEAHLRACAECRDRLAELKGFMLEADHLVVALDDSSPAAKVSPVRRSNRYRALGWAASIVFAVGLGFAGRSMFESRSMNFSPGGSDRMNRAVTESTDPSSPSAPGPLPPSEQPVAARPEADSRRTSGETAAPALNEARVDAERPMAAADSAPASRDSSSAVRREVAGNLLGERARRLNDAAAGAGIATTGVAPAQAEGKDSAFSEEQLQALAMETDMAAEGRSQASKQAEAAPPPAAAQPQTLQPRDELSRQLRLGSTGARAIPMEEAVRLLGGSIRLVDSLTPVRVELVSADSTVRVVYLTGGVEVWLDQRRIGSELGYARDQALAAIPGLASGINQMSWNDLQGFYMTLTGPLPTAELQRLKARIR